MDSFSCRMLPTTRAINLVVKDSETAASSAPPKDASKPTAPSKGDDAKKLVTGL